jgi:hypothetical protein
MLRGPEHRLPARLYILLSGPGRHSTTVVLFKLHADYRWERAGSISLRGLVMKRCMRLKPPGCLGPRTLIAHSTKGTERYDTEHIEGPRFTVDSQDCGVAHASG